jgi:hypothetical protein
MSTDVVRINLRTGTLEVLCGGICFSSRGSDIRVALTLGSDAYVPRICATESLLLLGVLRLRRHFAMRSNDSAQDDKINEVTTPLRTTKVN